MLTNSSIKLILLSLTLSCSYSIASTVDLGEELARDTDKKDIQIIVPSALLTDNQKQAIQSALSQMFIEQASSTAIYSQIVASLMAALQSDQVAESSKKFIAGLKDLIKVFFINVRFNSEQSAKVRDILETLKELAMIHINLNAQSIDDVTAKKIEKLQERLMAHGLPLSIGIQQVLTQEMIQKNQKHIVDLLLDLIKDVLSALPAGKAGAGSPPAIAEPLIPDRIELLEQDFDGGE